MVRVDASGLRPGSSYRFQFVVDGERDSTRGIGSFRTPGVGAESFRVALSSCARVGSNGRVFDAIAASDPLLYLAIGDIHYANIGVNSPDAFRSAYDRLLTEPGQAALYRQVPIAYVWDDHDYGPNDGDSTSPSRPAARQVYREVVPHAGVEPGDAPINQAFTIGRVRFVMTDSRSERTDDSMLGDEQLAWLIDELTESSRTHALVVWVNPVPWIVEARRGRRQLERVRAGTDRDRRRDRRGRDRQPDHGERRRAHGGARRRHQQRLLHRRWSVDSPCSTPHRSTGRAASRAARTATGRSPEPASSACWTSPTRATRSR